jgi:hypothetical protein
MSASSPMRLLFRLPITRTRTVVNVDGRKVKLPTKTPVLSAYWAARGQFSKPGLVLWVWSRHFRVLPLRRIS